ncbi:uncharacterized protein LOC113359751 [Papaver somniferum]|uniref:uncharacterized protein LOC113359751 n=1 Tax=Papaver somniferum TaxID=3469 RepID=UPI000E70005A|nr:uncharacterized protein LOC113359751 [Papaver somniferum]
MEGLSRMIQDSVDSKNITPIYPAKGSPPISHLFFADDCILFSYAKMSSINNIKDIINKFCKASGQMVNLSKSSIHFNRRIEEGKKQQICNTMNMNVMPLEEKYLGINLFIERKKSNSFKSIKEKMQRRLIHWQAGITNQAGRSTQIQVVTNSKAQFQMSCFILPKKNINDLEAIQRRYWWNRKQGKGGFLKSWESVNIPKRWEGMGFKNL